MNSKLYENLKKLCETPGVSGFEGEIRKTILRLFACLSIVGLSETIENF